MGSFLVCRHAQAARLHDGVAVAQACAGKALPKGEPCPYPRARAGHERVCIREPERGMSVQASRAHTGTDAGTKPHVMHRQPLGLRPDAGRA